MVGEGSSFGWFDLVVVSFVIVGMLRGRKRGMSEELLDLLQWLLIVVTAGFGYPILGETLAGITQFGLLFSNVLAYFIIAIGIKTAFSLIKRTLGTKLVGSDVFGRMEYYLGIVSGGIRFACMMLMCMALMNARLITDAQLQATARTQRENFGSISFPTFGTVQQFIFHQSFVGQCSRETIPMLLIKPTAPGAPKQEGIGRRREREMNEILGR